LDEFLESNKLKEEIDAEHLVFAKALDKVEEIFIKHQIMSEIVNK